MTSIEPRVDPTGLYNMTETAAALEIDRHTVARYAEQGCIKFRVRKAGRRKVTTGEQILRCWRNMYM